MTGETRDDPAVRRLAPAYRVGVQRRSAPPQVYRATGVDEWIVEPSRSTTSGESTMVFTGARAQHHALTYAYEKFGNARFFPY